MALIADCNVTTAMVTGITWVDPTTLNVPLTKNPDGTVDEAVFNHGMISSVSDGSDLCVQTIVGINKETNLQMTKWERYSSIVKGHVFGTDWSEWIQVG